MASAEFDEDSATRSAPPCRSAIPFAEKLLIEATLELMATGAVAAIQDMGAAGLTSSSVEMAGKGEVGIELNSTVPQREEGMTAYEMMLSESQERMLAILKPGREATATPSSRSGAWTPPSSAGPPTPATRAEAQGRGGLRHAAGPAVRRRAAL
jgi:phosphoribosylformylglycinamidine (FGAM) synthase-like enzyme